MEAHYRNRGEQNKTKKQERKLYWTKNKHPLESHLVLVSFFSFLITWFHKCKSDILHFIQSKDDPFSSNHNYCFWANLQIKCYYLLSYNEKFPLGVTDTHTPLGASSIASTLVAKMLSVSAFWISDPTVQMLTLLI